MEHAFECKEDFFYNVRDNKPNFFYSNQLSSAKAGDVLVLKTKTGLIYRILIEGIKKSGAGWSIELNHEKLQQDNESYNTLKNCWLSSEEPKYLQSIVNSLNQSQFINTLAAELSIQKASNDCVDGALESVFSKMIQDGITEENLKELLEL